MNRTATIVITVILLLIVGAFWGWRGYRGADDALQPPPPQISVPADGQ